LDVATGRGAVALSAAKRVGPNGRIIGVDIAPEMLRETAKDLASGDWPMIELRQMEAENLQFPDASFDCVLCGFALWFFPDPQHALQEFYRVLKSGGTLELTTIAHDSPFQNLVRETLLPHVEAASAANTPRPSQRFDTKQQLETVLRDTGLLNIRVTAESFRAVITQGVDWLWQHLWSGWFRRLLEQLPAPALSAARAD
jgi:ubiquinone/menaquinone biosynthesis C-methylase UbiE